jgi:hypothetical protein
MYSWIDKARVAASKPKALGMANARETIPKLRLRLPHTQAASGNKKL